MKELVVVIRVKVRNSESKSGRWGKCECVPVDKEIVGGVK